MLTKKGVAVYFSESDGSLCVYGGEINSQESNAVYTADTNGSLSVYGGKIIGRSTDYPTLVIEGNGANADIKGGEVVGENYGAVYCGNDGTVKILDGEVRSESATPTCIYNKGTLIVSGGKVSGDGEYGIRNYRSGATTTISGGIISCKGTGVYNYDNGVLEKTAARSNRKVASGFPMRPLIPFRAEPFQAIWRSEISTAT